MISDWLVEATFCISKYAATLLFLTYQYIFRREGGDFCAVKISGAHGNCSAIAADPLGTIVIVILCLDFGCLNILGHQGW
jgi:hypothetical protein